MRKNHKFSSSRSKSRDGVTPEGPLHLYGLHTVRAALDNPQRTKTVLRGTKNALSRLRETGEITGVEIEPIVPHKLDNLLGTDAVHQGLALEVAPLPRLSLDQLDQAKLLVVLDQITDPHNVGAILRTACAFGADAVITTARFAPRETGVMAKSASGAVDLIPLVEVNNLGIAIQTLKKQAFWCIGLDSEAEISLREAPTDRNSAIVLGAEGKGLRHKTRELCDQMYKLEMPGTIKSLNVSNAAAISLFALTSG